MAKEDGKQQWLTIATALSAAVLLPIGGGTGVKAIVDLIRGPQPVPEACVSYWQGIGDLKDRGFTGFAMMSTNTELGDRCGSPSEVAKAWPDD